MTRRAMGFGCMAAGLVALTIGFAAPVWADDTLDRGDRL